MALNQTTLTTSASAVFTSSGQNAITTVYLCNYSGSDVTVTLYAIPSGDSVGNGTMIYKSLPIAAGDTYIIDTERLILNNGDTIQAVCSANTSVTATVVYLGV